MGMVSIHMFYHRNYWTDFERIWFRVSKFNVLVELKFDPYWSYVTPSYTKLKYKFVISFRNGSSQKEWYMS
jgi:hypothetical protein